jgi:hypothetical protein
MIKVFFSCFAVIGISPVSTKGCLLLRFMDFPKASSPWWIGMEGLLYSEAELLFGFSRKTPEVLRDAALASVNSAGHVFLIVKQPHHVHNLLETAHDVVCYNAQRSLVFRTKYRLRAKE